MQASAPPSPQRFVLPGTWTSAMLMVIMLLALVMSLVTADWTDGLGLLAPVVLGGFALGMLVSFSRWSGLWPIVYSLLVGSAWVLYWVSRAPQVPIDLAGADRVGYVLQSFVEWFARLFGDTPARSNLIFLLQLSFLLWWLAYLAAWAVFCDGRPWRAIIPIGLILTVNMYYGPSDLKIYFVIFVICALLLAVRTYLAEQELLWRQLRVRYAEGIQVDFLRDGLIFAVVVVALATLLPTVADSENLAHDLGRLGESWQRVEKEWGRLFGSLNYQAAVGGRPAFGNSLTLGGPRNLGDTVIMDVKSPSGRYWRAVAYDTYTGRRWLSTSNLSQPVDFGTHVRTPEFQAREEVTQTITTYYPAGGVIFAAPQPVRVSLGATADLEVVEESGGDSPPVAEITMLRRRGPDLRDGQSYLVVSELSTANVEDLQEAGTDYPQWVRRTYLEVPPTVPDRVRELAQQVTAGATNPFDQAAALESFLRTYRYDDQIEAPPPGVDGVDYFLFESQAGYCDYYASAFAVMARSLGIPARVSAGYAQGTYDADVGAYRVLESNGHSWPEAYFPGYGWIEFEPTASELTITRPRRDAEQDQLGPLPTNVPSSLDDPERFGREPDLDEGLGEGAVSSAETRGWWLGIAAMLAVVGAAAFYLLRPSAQRRRQLRPDPQMVDRLYGRLLQWAGRLRLPLLASQTPTEHAAVLSRAVPEGQQAFSAITDLYVQEQYSPRGPDERLAQQVVVEWTGLEPVLRRYWLKARLGPLGRLVGPRPAEGSEE